MATVYRLETDNGTLNVVYDAGYALPVRLEWERVDAQRVVIALNRKRGKQFTKAVAALADRHLRDH